MKKLFPFLILVFLFNVTQALAGGTVKGLVTDKKTGEPLTGATVTLENENTHRKISLSVGLDGSFIFKNVAAGKYEIEVRYISYHKAEEHFTVNDYATVNLKLSLNAKANDLNEVSVKSRSSRESEQSAKTAEQRAPQLINAVSARTIEVSPDITIANVTQRVSGVSVERSNNGEAQYAIIRGMPQRYQYTLVNGVKIPSPDNKNRYVPLDIFPADIVDRLEVSKSLIPSMEGDAIGGGINLVLKDAPEDFTVRANIGTGYAANLFNEDFSKFSRSGVANVSPRVANGNNYTATMANFPNSPFHYSKVNAPLATIGGVTVGGRTADKKLGALVGFSYQNTYRRTNSTFFSTSVSQVTSEPQVTDIQSRVYDIQQQRIGLISKFDYRINPAHKLTLDADFINLNQNTFRFRSDTSLDLGRTGIGTGRVTQQYRSDRMIQKVYNFNLHGDHRVSDLFAMNWSAVYSKATANEPDRAELNLTTGRNRQGDGSVVQAPTLFDVNNAQNRTFAKNTDEDKSGFLNLIFSPKLFDTPVELSAGGMYRDKDRHSDYDQYAIRPAANNTSQPFTGNIDNNTFEVFSVQGTPSDPLNYDFSEKIASGYGQFKFTAGRLFAIGGVRYEHTDQSWVSSAPVNVEGKTGSIKYYDILPSVSLKYTLATNQYLRASYYSAISRPNFYELIPHTTGDPDADYAERGNPFLKRTSAENFDLRYEFFPKGLDQLLVGVFYKSIKNPVEYALIKLTGQSDLAFQPFNFGNANNYGFEFDVTKYFKNFGFRANYTYTDSKITTSKVQNYRDANGLLTNRSVDQTRPLQGQSKHIGNLSFLYKAPKPGVDAQVSLVYTGPRINTVSPFLDNDVWQKGFVTLDVSAEKRIVKGLYGYVKATNLLNTPFELEIRRPYPSTGVVVEKQVVGENTFVRRDSYRQYLIAGLRYKL
ncbi:TonB-dependent receptor [Mucilaginibacter sp. RS28]|uniref:TonB-dependent receptor n=1 Tax=Mucilaginibacter straminoryzae TaxID=2932774 RepID=A0A9X1X1G5_9SPHI|nr:TonB-dependent receptor [Mucilaginibacter straminoryzae]MCJ8209051.1 TonB-dependent receptor [Mucilaginibacter straminoryzae]